MLFGGDDMSIGRTQFVDKDVSGTTTLGLLEEQGPGESAFVDEHGLLLVS